MAESTCKEFEMESTGGLMEFQSTVLGTYILQNFLIKDRVVYGNMEAALYLFSIEIDNEDYDGSWMVIRALVIFVDKLT